tara:strand:+ start:155 stop:1198 length:1044 start_codon:yes stop_codon:yes gene_type:complete
MAWSRYHKYKKKVFTYKDYVHWSLSRIIKKQEELEEKLNTYRDILEEAENLKETTLQFREDFNQQHSSVIRNISLLVDQYNNVYDNGKSNFFEKFATSEKFKPGVQSRLNNIHSEIIKKLSELKNLAKIEAEKTFSKFGYLKYPFSKEIKGMTHHRGIDPVKDNMNYYDRSIKLNEFSVFYCNIAITETECVEICDRNISWSKRDITEVERFLIPVKKARSIIEQNKQSQDKRINKVKEEASKFKAQAYAFQEKTRDLSEEIKKEISDQQNVFPVCPYCEQSLGIEPHADHIYPVTLGGQATPENMVYVCAKCNLFKGALTLREFINKRNLNRDRVENNLSVLGKKF